MIWWLSIFASLLINYFFINRVWGLSVAVMQVFVLAGEWYSLSGQEGPGRRKYLLCGALLLVLSIPFIRFDFYLFKTLNLLLMAGIYGYMLWDHLPFSIYEWIRGSIRGLFRPFEKLTRFFTQGAVYIPGRKEWMGKLVLGLTLAAGVLIVVLPLLLSSDGVFNRILTAWTYVDIVNPLAEWTFRLIFFLFAAAYLYGYWMNRQHYEAQADAYEQEEEEVPRKERKPMDLAVSNIFLGVVDFVYLSFCFIQIKYLFLGNALPPDMNYSEYAREGFFQLVLVTVINLVIIVLVNHIKVPHLSVNVLLTITILCTAIMTVSAFYRMSLYEGAYGYTRLRLLVYLFLIGEGLTFIPICIGIFRPAFRYLETGLLILLIYYVGLTFLNVDGYVAYRNIERSILSQGQAEMDLHHLGQLSMDVLPVLDQYMGRVTPETADILKQIIRQKYLDKGYSGAWFEYNWSNDQAARLFEKYYPDLVQEVGQDEEPVNTRPE